MKVQFLNWKFQNWTKRELIIKNYLIKAIISPFKYGIYFDLYTVIIKN